MSDDHSETSAKEPSDIPDVEKPSLIEDDSNSDRKADTSKNQYAGSQSVIVDWNGLDDPEMPSNFPRRRKFAITIALAMMTLTTTFSSSIFSAAIPATMKRFNASAEVMTLGTSLWVLGIGLGPPVWGPLSELYGRKTPLFTGFIIFAIFQIPAAVAENLQSVLIFRFLQGLFGSSPPAVVGGSLADFWDARERGFAAPTFAGALFIGPLLGPIVGAFIADSYLGWRWTQWITLIMAAFFGTMAFFIIPETYGPVLLSRRAKRQRHQTGNWALHAKHEEREINLKEIGEKYLTRPARMMILEPILLLITLYLAFIYGLIYLFFEAYPVSFREGRHLSPGTANLPFLSIFVGVLSGCALLATTTRTKWAPNPQEGRYQETRLLFMALAGIVLPIGLFWFAWTSFPSINPWPQIIAGVPIGFGIMVITLQGLNYIIDCYTFNANSAIAANTFVRALFGAGFPMFANAMFHNLGVQWATSVLAFIAVALVPVPILFYKFGAKIRSYSKYTPT